MGTSFPTGKNRPLGRRIGYLISQPGSSRARAATFIETSPARMAGLIKSSGAHEYRLDGFDFPAITRRP